VKIFFNTSFLFNIAFKNVILAAIFLLPLNYVYAEQQGSLGLDSSVGEVEVAIEISELVKISNLNDFDFTNWNRIDDMEQSDLLCVYSNGARGAYRVSARGTGIRENFEVTDGTNNVPFKVFWEDDINSGANGRMLIANRSMRMTNANIEDFECNGNLNAKLTIAFLSRDLSGAFVSTYRGTVIITIMPE